MAYLIYAVSLILLGIVEFAGVGDGAQRWINLGIINLQPSEVMKVSLVLVLARYFHDLDENQVNRLIAARRALGLNRIACVVGAAPA